jgi:hypothetical protein
MANQMNACSHDRLAQRSAVVAVTYWSRNVDGGYEPEPSGEICLSKILSEETEAWVCTECGEATDVSRSLVT